MRREMDFSRDTSNMTLPGEIWRHNNPQITCFFYKKKRDPIYCYETQGVKIHVAYKSVTTLNKYLRLTKI